jgi:hypothetical protein
VIIDPNLTNSWTDQYTVGIDHQVINDLGVRVNYVRMMEQNPYASVNSAVNAASYAPVAFTDPGHDGIVGTADDQQITIYNLLPAFKGQNVPLITNFKGFGSNYSTVETSLTKRMSNRWMAQVSWDLTKRNIRQDISNDPNAVFWGQNFNGHYWDWSFKSVFMYQIPKFEGTGFVARTAGKAINGTNLTTTYDAQKGETFTRTISAPSSVLNQGTTTLNVEHNGQNFYPTINLWNLRAEKQFKFKEAQSISALFDLFNITNENTAIGWQTSSTSGQYNYERQITSILNPRIIRLGVRYNF